MPWARPRYEIALLALVAVAALSSVYVVSTQDVTRLCLTKAVLHGHLTIQPCAGNTIDQASYNNHNYTDKAPGFSFVAIPAAVITGLPYPSAWTFEGDPHLWAVRLLTNGLAFLLLAFLVGRVSEGIATGYGAPALVAFALGTYVAPLAASSFDHVLAGAFAFGAFLCGWSKRYLFAGLLAGMAADTDYTCGVIGIVLALYVLLAGARPLARFAIGAAPPLILLGAYDWAAFGSPFHLSYRYVANEYQSEQAKGFFGISIPGHHGIDEVFLGDRGLLVASPVVVAGAAGLFLLARRHRREAIAAGLIFGLLVLANCGYFNPYGGISPGPRFLVPSLPFVALGLAPAFARWFRATAVLAAASIVAMTTITLTWADMETNIHYRQTVWGEIVRVFKERQHARLTADLLTKNAIVWAGPNRLYAAGVVCLCAAAAFVISLRRA